MTSNKEANCNLIEAISAKDSQSQASCPAECCMCGDYGVSNELFRCKVCQFRYQHSYCSNLYPKAESYQVCNWCLSQRDEKDKSQNSSNSSSSNKINGQEEDDDSKNVKNKKKNNGGNSNNNRVPLMKSQRSMNLKLQQLNNKPIKKQRSPERSPPQPTPTRTTRKRIITNGALEEKKLIKRKKSEEIANNNNNNNNRNNNTVTTIRRPFFRNKVRRYKLLEEVSS